MTRDDQARRAHLGDFLSARVDGELAGPERQAADEHLAGCADCRAELDATAHMHQLVGGLPLLALPAPVWVAMTAMTARGRRPRPLVWGGAAAAVIGLSVLVATPSDHRVTPPIAHFVQVHTISQGGDPVTQLAPAAVPAFLSR
jgi:predicted anti-sigma-YlaC factor YlaD